MSSKKGGGRQYSGAAPNMRGGAGGAKKKSAGKGKAADSKKTGGRVRPARSQNAFSYDESGAFDRDTAHGRYDPDANASREYQLPQNFEDEDLDSDEEGIFDEADEEKYGDVFAKAGKSASVKSSGKGQKGKASHVSTEDDEVSMDDEYDEEEEDLEGFEGAETMDLSDMIGMDAPAAAKPAKGKKGQVQTVVKLTKQQQKMLVGDDDDDEEDDDDASMDEEDEDEDLDDDIIDDDEMTDAHKSLLSFVSGLQDESGEAAAPTDRKRGGKRGPTERTEAFEESAFSIPRTAGESSSLAGGLKLGDLLKKLPGAGGAASSADVADSTQLAALRKKFTVLQSSHTKTLLEPLPEIRQEEMTRVAAYSSTKEEVARWAPIINKHRDAAHLSFPLYEPGRINASSAELQTKFTPSQDSSLEADLKSLLSTYALKEDQLKKSETHELAQRHYTPEEISKREEQLAKMKALLFYQELKQKRVNKIKSKNYRRLKKKMREKGKLTLEEMKELDPDAYEAEQRKAEQKRIEERMSLQHSSQSKWMKNQLRLNEQMQGQNTDIKEAMKTHAATAAALKAKQEAFPKERNSDGEDDSDDSDDDAEEEEEDLQDPFADSDEEEEEEARAAKEARASESRAATIRAKLRQLESELGEVDESEPADGFDQAPGTTKAGNKGAASNKGERILGLKFMQKAAEKKREETRAMIRAYEAELDQEMKREELRRQNRREGKDELDEEELDAIIASSGTSMDGVDGAVSSAAVVIGRKKMDAKSSKSALVTGVGEDKIHLLPNSLQTAGTGKGSRTRVDGPIAVAAPKQSAASTAAAAAALQTKNAHPGQHHTVHGKSSVSVDTPFVSKAESEKLFPTEAFSDDDEDPAAKPTSVNTQLIDLVKIKHNSRAAAQAAKKQAAKAAAVKQAAPAEEDASENEDLDAAGEDAPEEESNPWAAASTANPRKALRDSELAARSKKKQKTGKTAAVAVANDDDDDEEEEDDEAELIDGGIDADLSGPLSLKSRRSEFDLLADGSLTQAELVRRAFSTAEDDALAGANGDDSEDEFDRMKREAMEEDLPKEEKSVTGLPGWGSWGGAGAVQHKSAGQLAREAAEKRARDAKRLAAIASRRDAKLKHVLINEKVDQKAIKYQVATLPYPFTSQEAYEKSLRTPVGREWNTSHSFHATIKPKIIVKAGEIIEPVKFNAKVGAAGKKEKKEKAGEKEPKKISGGGNPGQKRKR